MTTADSRPEGARLVLASTSPGRRELLARLGVDFQVRDPQIVESRQPGETGEAMVERLSRAKAATAADAGHWTIGSDQCAIVANQILGKPGSVENAVAQLQQASGQVVRFVTGVCVMSDRGTAYYQDETRVAFRPLSDDEIERYVACEQPLGCAGSFKVEGLGIVLFDAVHTQDPTALQGLPLIGLCRLLRAQGLHLP